MPQGTPRDPVSARAFRGHAFTPLEFPVIGLRRTVLQAPMPVTLSQVLHSTSWEIENLPPIATWSMFRGPDPTAAGTLIIGSVPSGVFQGSVTAFSDPSVPANEYIWVTTSAVDRDPHTLHITMEFE